VRNPAKWIVAAAVAGLAASGGGSALTASNTMPGSAVVSGYGEVTVSGATVTAVTDTLKAGDNSRLASVVFVSSTDLTNDTMTLTLKNAGTIVGTSYACSITTAWAAGSNTVTCDTSADYPLLNTFNTLGLSVHA
jgi:cysteine sulfinate desulfinase/cysteine desulfurase-like protein